MILKVEEFVMPEEQSWVVLLVVVLLACFVPISAFADPREERSIRGLHSDNTRE